MAIHVLYIEDEPDMLELVELILKRRGMEFSAAAGGIPGLEKIAKLKPDLVLLDLMMPDIDGWDVYAQLKENANWARIPVLIVTARAQSDERLQNVRIASNPDDYIIKPFGPSQLLDMIDRVMARTKTMGD
jgi:DNA-binding response OmpR family regulator